MKIRIEFEYETDSFKMSDGGILLKSSSGYFDMIKRLKNKRKFRIISNFTYRGMSKIAYRYLS